MIAHILADILRMADHVQACRMIQTGEESEGSQSDSESGETGSGDDDTNGKDHSCKIEDQDFLGSEFINQDSCRDGAESKEGKLNSPQLAELDQGGGEFIPENDHYRREHQGDTVHQGVTEDGGYQDFFVIPHKKKPPAR